MLVGDFSQKYELGVEHVVGVHRAIRFPAQVPEYTSSASFECEISASSDQQIVQCTLQEPEKLTRCQLLG